MMRGSFARVLRTIVLAGAIIAGSASLFSIPAHADTIATLAFSGAVWDDGGGLSGSITYDYNSANQLTQILSADIHVTAGTYLPSFTFVYDVPGLTSTAPQPSWDYNNGPGEYYEATLEDSATRSNLLFLDWSGIGTTARLAIAVPGNYTSDADYDTNSHVVALASAGTSAGSIVPEPTSIGLLLVGTLGIGACRQRFSMLRHFAQNLPRRP